MSLQIVEAQGLESKVDVLRVFDDLEWDLRRLVRRQLRGTPHRVEADRIATEIVVLVRSRWDGAASLSSWHEGARPQGWASVSLNALYERLRDLGVDPRKLLDALRRSYRWLERPLIIIDDTSKQKYGPRMEGVSSVHVANVPGSVMGHTFVTLMCSTDEGALLLDQRFKMNAKRPRLARRAGRFRTKLQTARDTTKPTMALDMIDVARAHGLKDAWVLFDCWYLSAAMAGELGRRHLTFISKAKSNTKFIVDGRSMSASEFVASAPSRKRVRQTDHLFYQKAAKLPDGTPVKLVATWFYRGRSLKQSTAVLVTNNLKVPGAEIVLTYLRRWATERAYEDWKGPLAGMDYHSTNLDSIETFVWVGFLAYALAARARQILAPGGGLPTLLARRRRATQTIAATDFRRPPVLETMTRKAA